MLYFLAVWRSLERLLMSGIAREQRGIVIILLSDRMVLVRRLGLEVGWVVVETVDREFRRVAVTRLFLNSTRRVM